MKTTKAIIGLGNIGSEFDNTYHNVGFFVVDKLLERWGVASNYKKLKNSSIIETNFKGSKVIVAKPSTYMNLSGKAVLEIMQKYKIKPEDIVVVFDDFDLPLGKVRYRERGSAGTHNGLRDIVSSIGTNFKRVKMGIGVAERSESFNLRDYVTSHFSEAEKQVFLNNVNEAINKIEQCLC